MFTLSVVMSFRVPKRLKEELDRLGIDYASEVRAFLERLARVKRAERLRLDMDSLRESIREVKGNLSAEFVREDRDER
ncbi:MAG: antitoxin [Candidatus Nezhaarchaeota archaeon]|nr:antitoxin [Candidatus Nezhaarchaeota archaeon]